jgi:FixJ family two-component response regulator
MFVDLKLPDGSGRELLVDRGGPRPRIVVITGNATIEAAVDALRQGALDFLTKPVDRVRLYAILAHVVRTRELRSKVSNLRSELRHLGRFGPWWGGRRRCSGSTS